MVLTLDPKSTALIVIDLQLGIVAREASPHLPADVVSRTATLAKQFRHAGATVVLVHVAFSRDDRDRLKSPADEPAPTSIANLPASWSDFVPELGRVDSDLVITKKQWGAFHGTELELQLRRRGIQTLVMTGIATNFGVESTARDAWERGFHLVFAEDAMSALVPGAHEFAITTIFPRLGYVRSSEEIGRAIGS